MQQKCASRQLDNKYAPDFIIICITTPSVDFSFDGALTDKTDKFQFEFCNDCLLALLIIFQ